MIKIKEDSKSPVKVYDPMQFKGYEADQSHSQSGTIKNDEPKTPMVRYSNNFSGTLKSHIGKLRKSEN